jgi:hypothetical protein
LSRERIKDILCGARPSGFDICPACREQTAQLVDIGELLTLFRAHDHQIAASVFRDQFWLLGFTAEGRDFIS